MSASAALVAIHSNQPLARHCGFLPFDENLFSCKFDSHPVILFLACIIITTRPVLMILRILNSELCQHLLMLSLLAGIYQRTYPLLRPTAAKLTFGSSPIYV
jgi:hypothetical protein